MALNNNQITAVLTTAVAMGWGDLLTQTPNPAYNPALDPDHSGVDTNGQPETMTKDNITLKDIVDTANTEGIVNEREKFTKALLDVCIKNWFKDSSYRSAYNDPWFVSEETFGSYIQTVSMDFPEARANTAWQNFENGVSKVGAYDVFIPVVHTEIYGKTVSWEINVTVTGEQWNTAFRNETDLASFVGYIHMMVDNALVMHLEELDMINRNNFIATKYALDKAGTVAGCNVVNLCEAIYKLDPSVATSKKVTVNDILSKANVANLAVAVMNGFSTKLTKPSKLFNTAEGGRVRFTPVERQVGQVQSDFFAVLRAKQGGENHLASVALKDVYTEIPYWQTSGDDYDIKDCTAIKLTTADGQAVDTKTDGALIVGFLADKWAISHTIKKRRVVTKFFEPEDLTTSWNQFSDLYANDLSMNAIVFIAKDYTGQ